MADTDLTDSRARMTGTVPPSKVLTTEIPRYVEDYVSRLLAIPDTASAVADASTSWASAPRSLRPS